MAQSVREALHLAFAPDKVRMILDIALMLDQRGVVPEEAGHARAFVYGPLLRTLEEHADEYEVEAILERLDAILTMAGSHIRRRPDDSGVRQTGTPAPARSAGEQLVLMSSLDRTSIQALGRQLDGRAKVKQISNVFDLISAIEAHYDDEPMIIIDCSLPAVEPMTLATMLPINLDEVRVVLWGATKQQRALLEDVMPVARHWIPCPSTANHDELSRLVIRLIG